MEVNQNYEGNTKFGLINLMEARDSEIESLTLQLKEKDKQLEEVRRNWNFIRADINTDRQGYISVIEIDKLLSLKDQQGGG